MAGLLDFGDMVETWTVCELAVAIAYAIFGKEDPLAAACHLAAGYDQMRSLSDPELEALWSLTAIRLCTSVCLSAHRRTAEPENLYLMVSEAPAWEALERMRAVHPRLAHYRLRSACGRTPCPQTPAIEAWLRGHRSEIGPVVDAPLDRAVVFDLSVGSPLFATPAETTDTPAMTAKLFAAMRARGTPVGIGRYDEARLLYMSDAFAGSGGEHPERRTVHIAIDIFMAPGSPVLAPLAGRVHGVRDNAARLDYGPTVILEHSPEGAPPFYTLYGHLTRASVARLTAGDRVERGQPIATIGPAPENGDWPPHVHFQVIADMLDMQGDFPGVAAASARAAWLSLCPDPNLILGGPPRFRAASDERNRLESERRRRLGPSLSLAYRAPLEIVRGAGTYLYDATGRTYLDMVNNVAHVGHCHPRVVRAGARQMAVLNTNTRYLHPSIVRYAERLTATLPDSLSVCFFVCSGSEANELALRMARAKSGGRGVVVVDGAYHGNTQGLVDVSPYKAEGPGGHGLPAWVRKAPMPDDYRGLYRRDNPARGEKFACARARGVRRARGRRTSGRPPSCARACCPAAARSSCRPATSPPRTPTRAPPARSASPTRSRWASAASASASGASRRRASCPTSSRWASPSATAIRSAAVVTTPEIAAAFANGMEYFNTFGGNPVSCEIGLAVLDVIRDERLQERALAVGGRLKAGLRGLAERHPIVGDVRGLGLFLGIELVRDRAARSPAADAASYVVERMKDHGILLSTDGPEHNVIKMKPPLTFSEADADRAVRGLRPRALGRLREGTMNRLVRILGCLLLAVAAPLAASAAPAFKTENVVVIVTDGLRWQEVFRGAETALVSDKPGGVEDVNATKAAFWRPTPKERREALLPFLWTVVAKDGQIYGNADVGSASQVTNGYKFSYPGYNEIITGAGDPRIDKNEFGPNPNVSVFEWFNGTPELHDRVAVVGRLGRLPRDLQPRAQPPADAHRLGHAHSRRVGSEGGAAQHALPHDHARVLRHALGRFPPADAARLRREEQATAPLRRIRRDGRMGPQRPLRPRPAVGPQRGRIHPRAVDGDAGDAPVQGQDDLHHHDRPRPRRRPRELEAPRLERRRRREHVDRRPRAGHARARRAQERGAGHAGPDRRDRRAPARARTGRRSTRRPRRRSRRRSPDGSAAARCPASCRRGGACPARATVARTTTTRRRPPAPAA